MPDLLMARADDLLISDGWLCMVGGGWLAVGAVSGGDCKIF
jgi:hypothetical protein